MVMHSWSSAVLLKSKTGRRQESGHKGMKIQASEQELPFHNVYFIVFAGIVCFCPAMKFCLFKLSHGQTKVYATIQFLFLSQGFILGATSSHTFY